MIVRPDVEGHFPQLVIGPIQRFFGSVALGNMTQWRIALMRVQDGVILAIPERNYSALFTRPVDDPAMWQIGNDAFARADLNNLLDFINDQFDGKRMARHGYYLRNLCAEKSGEDDE